MRVREYGSAGPWVVVLHGGPGAPGYMAPVADGLGRWFRVLEPFQRWSGTEPLTVARHVADLHELVGARCGSVAPAIVGHSWGAMLALAFAAAHPESAGPLVLVGCGTFDRAARAQLRTNVEARLDDAMRRKIRDLETSVADPDERLRALGRGLLPLYSYDVDVDAAGLQMETCDARAHTESWNDMVRLQDEGAYPAAFAAIKTPVLMLHGADDPHPGSMIRDGLKVRIPQLDYHGWARCGHYPWLERAVGDDFFEVLRAWLERSGVA